MQLLNIIQPAFLKRFDHYLLTRYPVIWRTKAHFFLFYSLLVGNIAAALGALAFPVRLDNVLTIQQFDLIYILSFVFMAFVSLAWGFSQVKFPLRSSRMGDIFKTLVLYAFSVLCLATNIWMFQHVLIQKTANVINNTEFASDWSVFKGNSIIQSYQYEAIHDLSQLDQIAIAPFLKLAKKYGVERNDIYPDNYNELGQIRLYSYQLNNVFESLEAAKYYAGFELNKTLRFDFDNNYEYGYYYSLGHQIRRLEDHRKTSMIFVSFLPGILFLTSLFSFRSLLAIGISEFVLLAGLGILDESYYVDFPVSLSVFFVSIFTVIMIYGKNSGIVRIGLGMVYVTVPVMLMVGFFWTGTMFLSETVWAAILSIVILTGFGKIMQGRILEPKTGDSLV